MLLKLKDILRVVLLSLDCPFNSMAHSIQKPVLVLVHSEELSRLVLEQTISFHHFIYTVNNEDSRLKESISKPYRDEHNYIRFKNLITDDQSTMT